jgi:hypothetical protein
VRKYLQTLHKIPITPMSSDVKNKLHHVAVLCKLLHTIDHQVFAEKCEVCM